ncbi:MAG TPA: DUF2961 domain-containing protein [bacterium]|nr:DUF2961 domain-containing protein [bacterium]
MKAFRCVVYVLMICICGSAAYASDYLRGNPMDDIFMLREGRSMRASSSDPAWETGNADWRPFGPNSEIVLADLEGPGIITHIWMTIANKDRHYPSLMALRMYWDGEKEPAVEAPVGDFFAVGNGMDVPVNSIPVQVSSEGRARNCFWPMPFRKGAKIVFKNENSYSGGGVLYWYVDWVKVDNLPEDTAYFHAQYRQEYPASPGRYLVMRTRGRGHYVGTVLSWLANMPSWIGEGDDFFYIDGEKEPSIRGTGTEDYFSDAWGFRQFNQPYHGVTVWEGERSGSRTTAYRWHLADPVMFNESLKFEIEHTGPLHGENGERTAGYGVRKDHMSSVAYWYEDRPGGNWERMPKGLKRLPPHKYIEAEKRYMKAGETPEEIKIETGYEWSGGGYVSFTPGSKNRRFEIRFQLNKPNRFEMSVDLVRSPEMGIYKVSIDGRNPVLLTELEYKTLSKIPYDFGTVSLDAGKHRIIFDYIADGQQGGRLGVDGLYMRPVNFSE